jgi:hypothetical protein
VSGQLHSLAALPPENDPPVPIRLEAGWAPEPVWTRCRREKFPAPAGTRTPVFQLVDDAHHYRPTCKSWFSGLLYRVVWWSFTIFSEDFRVQVPQQTTLQGTTTQKTTNCIFTAVETSNVAYPLSTLFKNEISQQVAFHVLCWLHYVVRNLSLS